MTPYAAILYPALTGLGLLALAVLLLVAGWVKRRRWWQRGTTNLLARDFKR